jgi:hypothetical protein
MTMPAPNEEQNGYRWNPTVGGWVNLKTGFLKKDELNMNPRAVWLKQNHPQDYAAWVANGSDLNNIPKPSDYSSAVGTFRTVAGGLANPAQYVKNVPVLGSVASIAQEALPTTYVGRGMQQGEQGNLKGAATNFGLALLPSTFKVFPAAKALPGVAGWMARHPGTTQLAAGVIGSVFSPNTPTYARDRLTAGSVLPGRTTQMTPEQYKAMEEANRNRTDASGSSGMGGGRNYIDYRDWFLSKGLSQEEAARLAKLYVDTNIAWTAEGKAELEAYRNKQASTGTTPSAPATPAAPGLLPLSPEQIDMFGQERLAAEQAYEDLLNEQKLQKSQAQQNYTQDVQNYQRYAAGSAADLAGQMMSADYGTGSSPATAFGIEEMVQSPLVSRSLAARKNLDQYLAGLVEKQKQAKAQKDAAMLNIKKQETQARVDNTFNQQLAGYQGIGGR